jgi:pyruvate/2-oxoglutarate/acetoin dehydrogenase E1 component/TPP-dependent pyruvate/acetoin dehydrogenase alpha subunit
MSETKIKGSKSKQTKKFLEEAIEDFRVACLSREASLSGRKEVLRGKAKFGIFGDGKEIAQVAMARVFKEGDFRSGYYRDQTFMLASGLATVQQLYAQLYAHADAEQEPFSGGRQMNAHFATPLIDKNGEWLNHTSRKNVSSDISPTAGQMARALGLALASKKYRECKEQLGSHADNFSVNGNEVSFCTIGDASTSEGVFWETINAAGVLQVPLAVCVWDDGYGISVPRHFQTTKGSISEVLKGFNSDANGPGVDIYTVKGWDYVALRETFEKAIEKVRKTHTPCLFHVQECTQPQGHSTSGSHERYKSSERLEWEKTQDGIEQMKAWLIGQGAASLEELNKIQEDVVKEVRDSIRAAFNNFNEPVKSNVAIALSLIDNLLTESQEKEKLTALRESLAKAIDPIHKDVARICRQVLYVVRFELSASKNALEVFTTGLISKFKEVYTSKLYSDSEYAALKVQEVKPIYTENSPQKSGFEILNACFDHHLGSNPSFFAFGEDVGKIGDVNQGFMGMQDKYGIERVFDVGIREWTIIGQAIGMAMRGLRPLAEIQYLDYLIYAVSALSDDLATLRYRSNSIQKAPAIIRTRGHRLEGIWHSGSQLGLLLSTLRGICVLVPRDMTRAVGFYNTMLKSDDPCVVVECLNGYRLKEQMPENLGEFTVPVGVPEVLQEGTDLTLVTYGSCVRVAQEAMKQLEELGVSIELIDVQSLLPFDVHHQIVESVKKTNRLVVLDEDVSGATSAFIMDKIMVEQKAYYHLDSEPITIHAEDVRPAYGSDADYFIKPSSEDVFERIYALMHEVKPAQFPKMYFM